MPGFTLVRTAAAPADVVFEVLADSRGYPAFTPLRRVVLERPGSAEPDGVGAIRRMHALGPPLREEILEFERPRLIRYRLLSGAPLRDHVGSVVLTPDGEGTRVAYSIETTPTVPLVGPVAMRVVRAAVGRTLRGAVREAERRARA